MANEAIRDTKTTIPGILTFLGSAFVLSKEISEGVVGIVGNITAIVTAVSALVAAISGLIMIFKSKYHTTT